MGASPDYNLSALDKDSSKSHKVGAAWRNENGSISIVLDRFVVLRGSENIALTLFPKNKQPSGEGTPSAMKPMPADDDIPF